MDLLPQVTLLQSSEVKWRHIEHNYLADQDATSLQNLDLGRDIRQFDLQRFDAVAG